MALTLQAVSLEGKVAVVTGAAVGIGKAIAETFANFGADVAVCDRDRANLDLTAAAIVGAGRQAIIGELDVRDREAVDRHVAEVVERFGRIDILVNNAGGTFFSAFTDISARGQDSLVRENFHSVTNFVRACTPRMGEGASIINVTSIEAHRAAPGFAVYAAMKTAVTSLTRTLALELGARFIRVNTIAPDMITTPGVGEMGPANGLPRPGTADDCAGAAVFLASDLSAYVTGSTIHVDGGNLAAGGWRRKGVKTYDGTHMGQATRA
jgi:NAD(P)-dependent dehydrogenase (short-subunit alcohol dehydrogenase family)